MPSKFSGKSEFKLDGVPRSVEAASKPVQKFPAGLELGHTEPAPHVSEPIYRNVLTRTLKSDKNYDNRREGATPICVCG